ncbi:MAG: glutamate--tRNA ligase, partial [Ignisphaera sp.]|nr:glutamate--tRNA ligase [Ignisphaera sp.]
KRPLTFSYKVVEEDLAWLGIKWNEKYIQSLRIETFYEIAKKLIEMNYAYVDLCKAEVFREYRNAGKACPHRNQDPAQNMELFEKILAGEFREGEAVIRLKTDLSHPDPSVRDWVMMRIVDVERYPHPIVGDRYRLWPTYNFAAAVDDHLMGITHILRGKEHAVNTVKQLFLYKYLGWRYPEVVHFGRVGLEGLILSKSWIKTRLKEHPERFMGFDDIRFATIAALRRRGILPETIREVIISLGLSPTDARVSWANIAAINRKNADPIAKRLFVVCKPIKVIISGVELPKEVEIPYHPSKDLGKRRIVLTKPEVYVSEYDVQKLAPGSVVRLMELFNIEIKQIDRNVVTAVYHSSDLETARRFSAPIIQWVPCENNTRIELISADGMRLRRTLCIGESSVALLKKDEIIQMVRIGFGRIDEIKKNRVRIILAHE